MCASRSDASTRLGGGEPSSWSSDAAREWVRQGIATVFDGVECGFLRGEELMRLVVGVDEVNIAELRSITKYDGFEAQEDEIRWFWEVLEEMSPAQRTSFLQFATARSRLPVFSHQSPLTVGGGGDDDA